MTDHDETDGARLEGVVEERGGRRASSKSEKEAESQRIRSREYARRKRMELRLVQERILVLYKELVCMGAYQRLSEDSKEFLSVYVMKDGISKREYPSPMFKMFNGNVEIGACCTLKEAMQRLYKGKNEINYLVRCWEKRHGIVVDKVPDENGSGLDMKYVIVSLGEPGRRLKEQGNVEVADILCNREREEYRIRNSR